MRSSTFNPTVDSLEGDGELRVEQGRDSIWSGCQKAPYSAPFPPNLEARRGEKKDWQSNRRDMRQDKVALGPGHKKERRSQKDSGRGEGLPWWRSRQEPACQYRGHRFDPWSRKILRALEQLGPRATTTEPTLCNY